jgi:protein disulfide-isomerase
MNETIVAAEPMKKTWLLQTLLTFMLVCTGMQANAVKFPYNPAADAEDDVRRASAQAKAEEIPMLLLFGANWCEVCRDLDRAMKAGSKASLLSKEFKIVKIDVGNFDHNMELVKRYGDPIDQGIPGAVIVAPDGKILYTSHGTDLPDPEKMDAQGVYQYFKKSIGR